MVVAAITSKHQITIPSPVRRRLGLRRGDRIAFIPDKNGNFTLSKSSEQISDGFARKFVRPVKAGAAKGKAQASRQAAAAAYRRRNG